MASRCPNCDHPLEQTASRNDRRMVSINIPEEILPLMVEVMRESNNRYVMYGEGEKAGRLRVVLDAVHDAKPEELRAFDPNGWARALEGVSKGYDVRIETQRSRDRMRDVELPGKTDVRLMVDLPDKGTIVLAVAGDRDDKDVPGIVAYVQDAFERFRPMR